jgi:hypothetical protein
MYDESISYDAAGHRPYCYLSLIMDSSELNEGTCKRIEVGEKTFTQKIYQVVCDEGFTEMMGKAEEMDEDTKTRI